MKMLVADDSPVTRRILQRHLARWGFDVVCAQDGAEATSVLAANADVNVAIVDWDMPALSGVDLCRRIRAREDGQDLYILMCTSRDRSRDVVEGLEAGADDYLVKPVDHAELRARVHVGVRTVSLRIALRDRVTELEDALAHIKRLEGLLPICMFCKRIRDEGDRWQRIEDYVTDHADVSFSHGLCEPCMKKHYPDYAD